MALSAGTRLGPYEILSLVGSGGMGEIYKARDTRLDRTVAIKVLASQLTEDPEFRTRFDREAKAISALDHPHICVLYDVGAQGGTSFLVMQYLEGETLEERLKQGALPVGQALGYAIHMVDALDKAHRIGIVHRDLKPGNIMLTKSGAKLLDFGLAKASVPAGPVAGPSMMPTTPPNLTAQGSLLGTFQYMAPEQLEGKEADARSDIFAFGAVLYEMLTGRRAFTGQSQASLISAIMSSEPPAPSTLQRLTPSSVDRLVATCLAKDPDNRWQSARDLLLELKWTVEHAGHAAAADMGAEAPGLRASGTPRVAWIVAAASLLVGVLALAIGAALYIPRAGPEPAVTRLDVVTPPTTDPFSFALSPDGRQLVFAAEGERGSQLWIRPLDQVTGRPLAGTEGAAYPFWSPDSRAIGFFADGRLKRFDLPDDVTQVVAAVPGARGGTWNRDGIIVFAPQSSGLLRVAASGGTPTPLTHLAAGEGSHRWPQFLPDGRRFLFLVAVGQASTHGVYLGSLDGREPIRLLAGETAAMYAPPGYLLNVISGTLVAHRFDADRGFVASESVPVAQSVGTDDGTFHSAFSVSGTGVLAHRTGGAGKRQLTWVDRMGKTVGVVGSPDDAALGNPALAPDGRRVAVQRLAHSSNNLWLLEASRGIPHRFTFDPAADSQPIWSPDGSRIVFASIRNGKWDLFEKPADSAVDEQPLLTTAQDKIPLDWSSDGRMLLYQTQDPKTGVDIWALPLVGERKPFPVTATSFDEREGQFSPDGRWVAYVSNETGRDEVYVQPFQTQGRNLPVSTAGGIDPRWRRDGRELFYVAPDGHLMAVPIQVTGDTPTLNPGAPVSLFRPRFATGGNVNIGWLSRPQYAVTADGRFLMNVSTEDAVAFPITIVQNWMLAVKK